MEKHCTTCRELKPIAAFQKRAASHDGMTAACKECLKKRDAKRYLKERDYRLMKHSDYMKTSAGKKARKNAALKWREQNRTKRAAHVLLGNALRAGTITRKDCEVCGSKRTHGHHEDYTKPLDVVWLCPRHHKERHAGKV